MQAKRACLGERRAPGRSSRKPNVDTFTVPAPPNVVVFREGDRWLVGVGKRAPYGFSVILVSPHVSLDRLKSLYIISSKLNSKRQTKQHKK